MSYSILYLEGMYQQKPFHIATEGIVHRRQRRKTMEDTRKPYTRLPFGWVFAAFKMPK